MNRLPFFASTVTTSGTLLGIIGTVGSEEGITLGVSVMSKGTEEAVGVKKPVGDTGAAVRVQPLRAKLISRKDRELEDTISYYLTFAKVRGGSR